MDELKATIFPTDWVDPCRDPLWETRLCMTKCMRSAAMTIDGEPYCWECAEDFTEYWIARSQYPEIMRDVPAPHLRNL